MFLVLLDQNILQQYVGRLHRLYHSKKEVRVYDYDEQVSMLQRMFAKRKSGYRAMGYLIRGFNDHSADILEIIGVKLSGSKLSGSPISQPVSIGNIKP